MFEQPEKRTFYLEDYENLSELERDILLHIKVNGFVYIDNLKNDLRSVVGYREIPEEEFEKALLTLKSEAWIIEYREGYFKIDNESVHGVIEDYNRGLRSYGIE